MNKKSIYFEFFDINRSLLITFRLNLISFDLFNITQTHRNQFCHDDSDSDHKFGMKNLIKRRFDHNIKQKFTLDRLHRQSLVPSWSS